MDESLTVDFWREETMRHYGVTAEEHAEEHFGGCMMRAFAAFCVAYSDN